MESEYEGGITVTEEAEGCATPKHEGYRIALVCPPPPKKKPEIRRQRQPPKEGYFRSPEIDLFFATGHIN